MSEPKLEDIEDYNNLKGEKKKVVWSVILAGLVMGIIYSVVYNFYNETEDNLATEHLIRTMPMK